MNVFGLRDNLVADYQQCIRSFFMIGGPRIRKTVERHLAEGALWPDPLLQLNPSFLPSATGRVIRDSGSGVS